MRLGQRLARGWARSARPPKHWFAFSKTRRVGRCPAMLAGWASIDGTPAGYIDRTAENLGLFRQSHTLGILVVCTGRTGLSNVSDYTT